MTFLLRAFLYAVFAYFFILLISSKAYAELEVDVELVLAVDVSRSMDGDEILLQRQGYQAAFRHPDVLRAIRAGAYGRIAVTYIEWADRGRHKITVPWMIIDSKQSAELFAKKLSQAALTRMRRTSLGDALLFSASLFQKNHYRGIRRVIDISGDGPSNDGLSVVSARDRVTSQGIIINGLPILLKKSVSYTTGKPEKLDIYYEDCVIGGPGSFIIPVRELSEFVAAIRKKIILEVAGRAATVWRAQFFYRRSPRVSCADN